MATASYGHRGLELCFRWRDPEVLATYQAEVGTSMLFISGSFFVNVAILHLANEAAGCEPGPRGTLTECTQRVHGVRPSSIVALISTAAGLLSSAFMPYAGAIVDHTSRRRAFGATMATLATVCMLSLAFLTTSTWFPLSITSISLGALAYYGHSIARWSYLREIVASDSDLFGVVASMRFWMLLGQLCFLGTIVLIASALGLGDVATSHLSQVVSVGVCGPMLFNAWRTFRPRPAKHSLGAHQSLWVAGALQLWGTLGDLRVTSPGLHKLLLVQALVAAPTVAFPNLAVTYLTQQLAVRNAHVAIFAALTALSGLPGALLFRACSKRAGPRPTLLVGLGWWVLLIFAFAWFLRGPQDRILALALAVPTGLAFGWLGPAMTSFIAALMPPGRESELWGFATFAQVSLTWLPPVAFTVINEAADDMRLGMASLNIYALVAMTVAAMVTEPSFLGGSISQGSPAGRHSNPVQGAHDVHLGHDQERATSTERVHCQKSARTGGSDDYWEQLAPPPSARVNVAEPLAAASRGVTRTAPAAPLPVVGIGLCRQGTSSSTFSSELQ